MAERLVVIGGDAGGMTAATNARRLRADLEIVAFEQGPAHQLQRLRHPVPRVGRGGRRRRARRPHARGSCARPTASTCASGHEVMGIDLDRRQVEVHDRGHDRTFRIGFDHLLIGTGARPSLPDLPGVDGDQVRGVQTLEDGVELLAFAEKSRCQRVVVVGGGYIGLEMAEAFVMWGADVTLVDSNPHVMRTLDPDMAALVEAALERHSIEVRTGVQVTGFEPGTVHTDDGPDRRRPGRARPRGAAQLRAGRGGRHRRSAPGARSRSTAASRRTSRACGPPATAPSRSTWSASGRCTWRSARWPTARVGWPASTSAAATPPSRVWSAPPSPRCAAPRSARTGLTEAEAARDGFQRRGRHHREHHPRRLLPGGRRPSR